MLEKLGPYRLDKQIGRGGMGAVYAGVNEETGQKAAIKILAAGFAEDPGFRNRFLSEIETLKQLRHPNIVRLFGDGEQDGQLFYVMELVEGTSLQEELQAGHRYDWLETTDIAIQICQALKHAHDHGVIHRDLKPANLLRASDDQIKLTDFGIAKLFGGTNLTAAGSVVGTADFMSPEQAEGRGVTYRSDLYSLGTVMFTLLARRPPFAGASLPQVVHKLRYEEAPSVRRFNPHVPSELEQIIHQLLNKAPEARVATALVLSNRLKAMKHGLANAEPDSGAMPVANGISRPSTPAQPSDEEVTRVSKSNRGQNTELNPTAVDDPDQPANRDRAKAAPSWNDATVATGDVASDKQATGYEATGQHITGSEASASGHSGVASREHGGDSSKPTVVETQLPVNRFTTIEADQQRQQQAAVDKAARWRESLKVVAMVICLAIIIALTVWGLTPKSADRLYSEIVRIKATGTIDDAGKQIDEFLARFPTDARANEVNALQLEILSERLFSILARRARKETLPPVEAKYVQAMKDRTEKPARARDAFLELVRDGRAEASSADALRCIEYAGYQLQNLADQSGPPE